MFRKPQGARGSKEERQNFVMLDSAPVYSIRLDPKAQQPGHSSLTVAIETSRRAGQAQVCTRTPSDRMLAESKY